MNRKQRRAAEAAGKAAQSNILHLASAFRDAKGGAYWPKKQEGLAVGDHGIIVAGTHDSGGMMPGWVTILERAGDVCRVEVKARRVRAANAAFDDMGRIDTSNPATRTISVREILPITAAAFDEAMAGQLEPSVDLMLGRDFNFSDGRWIATNHGPLPGLDVAFGLPGGQSLKFHVA